MCHFTCTRWYLLNNLIKNIYQNIHPLLKICYTTYYVPVYFSYKMDGWTCRLSTSGREISTITKTAVGASSRC